MRLAYIALAWISGILLAANNPALPLIWLALLVLSLLVTALVSQNKRIAAVCLVAFTLGGWRVSTMPHSSAIAAYNNMGGLTIEGIVVDAPDVRENGVLLRVDADSVTRAGVTDTTDGLVLVRAPSTTQATYGDRVRATGLLIAPAEFDTFSYADYLARAGVYSILTRASVEVVSGGHGNPVYTALADVRRHASAIINAALPEPAAGLLNGMLLGDERGIAPATRDAFAATGAAHLLAISGFNMVVLARVVLSLFRNARSRRATVAALVSIAAYSALIGATPAVLRAALMSGLLVTGETLRRKTFVPASLAFAVIVLSLFNPLVLWDVGFQLSFFATLGLALLATPLTQRLNQLCVRLLPASAAGLLRSTINEPLAVSLAAQVATLPLTALYFGHLSLASPLVNLLIVPVQPALLVLGGLATMIAPLIFPLAQALFWIVLVLVAWTVDVVRWFAQLPGAQTDFSVDARLVLLFYVLLIGWGMAQATQPEWLIRLARFTRSRAVLTSTLLAGVCTVFLTGAVAFSRPDGLLHVWLLDVGGYNAVLAQTPNGAQYLVDGGSFPSRLLTALGDRMPFNDREIEVIAITQPDEANFSALRAVLERYEAGVILTNGQNNLGEAWSELQAAAGSTEQLAVRAGYRIASDDGVTLEVLHPLEAPALEDNLNDGALALRLSFGEVSFLLPSDLSEAGQTAMLEAGILPLATVLQVPQGGGALDEAFLAAVQPQIVVIQSDSASRQENADTLALLGDLPQYYTDEGGSIHLSTDGHRLWVVQERR